MKIQPIVSSQTLRSVIVREVMVSKRMISDSLVQRYTCVVAA